MKRPQFRLSTLLWLTLAVACWFGGREVARREYQKTLEGLNDPLEIEFDLGGVSRHADGTFTYLGDTKRLTPFEYHPKHLKRTIKKRPAATQTSQPGSATFSRITYPQPGSRYEIENLRSIVAEAERHWQCIPSDELVHAVHRLIELGEPMPCGKRKGNAPTPNRVSPPNRPPND